MKAFFQDNSLDGNDKVGVVDVGSIEADIEKTVILATTNVLPKSWQGQSRKQCLEFFSEQGLKVTKFAHWLAVPKLNLLLTFSQQQCVDVRIVLEMA